MPCSSASNKPPSTAPTFAFLGFPNPITAGTKGSVTITAKDAKGKTVTTYTGIMKITSTDTSASLPADYTFQASDKGVHNFADVTLNTPGSQSITATDSQNSSISGSQTAITVKPITSSAQ